MNIGIILPTLEYTQLAYEAITAISNEIKGNSPHDFRIFFENLSPRCLPIPCGVMNISEMWHYDGVLISTTLNNTMLAANVVGNVKRVFLVWDLEWLRGESNFLRNIQIYRNPTHLLLTRSQEHATALEHYCNRKVNGIMPEFALGELANAFDKQQ